MFKYFKIAFLKLLTLFFLINEYIQNSFFSKLNNLITNVKKLNNINIIEFIIEFSNIEIILELPKNNFCIDNFEKQLNNILTKIVSIKILIELNIKNIQDLLLIL
jgi:hypothetical protein